VNGDFITASGGFSFLLPYAGKSICHSIPSEIEIHVEIHKGRIGNILTGLITILCGGFKCKIIPTYCCVWPKLNE
jgi:hypothetical protein